MAYCCHCQNYIPPQELSSQEVTCPKCFTLLKFNKSEYKGVVRPGIYVILLFVVNSFFTDNHMIRLQIDAAIILIWFAFYFRFRNYLKQARLEKTSYEAS